MFGGLTHEPAVGLAARLVEITPEPLRARVPVPTRGRCPSRWRSRCACSTGARAGRPERRRLLTWRGGYYGDTLSPMSLCDPDGGMHHLWSGDPARARCSPTRRRTASTRPPTRLRRRTWPTLVEAHADELAAIIVEPVVQGAGGMRFHSPAYLRALRELADAHDVLLVFDEIATGFGRTGALFAAEPRRRGPRRDVRGQGDDRRLPDDGRHPLHAAGGRGRSPRGEVPVLAHGPTFMGNPLAAAVANASIDLLLARDWRGRGARGSRPACGRGWRRRGDLPGVRRRAGARRDRRRPARPRGRHGGGDAGRRSSAACGCGPSATSSTRCRPT